MLDALKKSGAVVILPLAFPEAPEVETPEKALDVDLEELEHWSAAPANPGALARAGVPFALTLEGIDKPEKNFWPRLRTAVKRGLTPDAALAALTTAPAKLLGVEARYGSLEKGKTANLIVASGDLFTDEHAFVAATWINGEEFDTDKGRQKDLRGTYAVTYADPAVRGPAVLKIDGDDPGKPKVTAARARALPPRSPTNGGCSARAREEFRRRRRRRDRPPHRMDRGHRRRKRAGRKRATDRRPSRSTGVRNAPAGYYPYCGKGPPRRTNRRQRKSPSLPPTRRARSAVVWTIPHRREPAHSKRHCLDRRPRKAGSTTPTCSSRRARSRRSATVCWPRPGRGSSTPPGCTSPRD